MNPKDKRSPLRRVLTRVVELLNHLPGADRIAVRNYVIESDRIPVGFNGCRIVHISDLHGRWFGAEQEKLLEAVRRQKPEMILMTGDWIDRDYQGEDERCCQVVVKGLLEIAPVYGIIGNHEARAKHRSYLIEQLRNMGVRLLLDESIVLKRRGDRIRLAGFKTPYHAPLNEDLSELKRLEEEYCRALSGRKAEKLIGDRLQEQNENTLYRLVMAHRPELIDMYRKLELDLVLSGHAHGGLMKLPFGRRLLAPGQSWLPKYTHGLYQKENTCMIVSCGLGGPRIGIQPEIGVIVLKNI
ncbi:MAG: metallophosphoesterase [Firmicutes bacterium]|nr:metallophosphoesterase [Bacillota bacterium]